MRVIQPGLTNRCKETSTSTSSPIVMPTDRREEQRPLGVDPANDMTLANERTLRNTQICSNHPVVFYRCCFGTPFIPMKVLILSNRVTLDFLKTTLPGTTSVIWVPEPAELTSVSLLPIRRARSRIPCRPKCPCLPSASTAASMPIPLSFTRSVRSRA